MTTARRFWNVADERRRVDKKKRRRNKNLSSGAEGTQCVNRRWNKS